MVTEVVVFSGNASLTVNNIIYSICILQQYLDGIVNWCSSCDRSDPTSSTSYVFAKSLFTITM